MHDWNHDGKVDLLDGFIQDEIESRNTGNRSTGSGSGGGCITILLVPIIILFLYALVMNAPSCILVYTFPVRGGCDCRQTGELGGSLLFSAIQELPKSKTLFVRNCQKNVRVEW